MPSPLEQLGPHHRVIGLGLAAVGLVIVVYFTLFGALFTKPSRGGGRAVFEIGLVQHRECYLDRGGVACHAVHRGLLGSRIYEALRWTTLGSLSLLIVALASFITNRLNPGGQRFPEPTAGKGVVLFAEVLTVSLPLAFLKPASWSLAPGFVIFELGVVAVLVGCVLRAVDVAPVSEQPPGDAAVEQPEDATGQAESSSTAAAEPAGAKPEPPGVDEPSCRRCGKTMVFRLMHKRYHCPACGLYGPPLDLPD